MIYLKITYARSELLLVAYLFTPKLTSLVRLILLKLRTHSCFYLGNKKNKTLYLIIMHLIFVYILDNCEIPFILRLSNMRPILITNDSHMHTYRIH